MYSKLDIFNGALGLIGQPPLTSPYDEVKEAGMCRMFYGISVELVLRKYPFSVSLKRVILAPDAEKPAFDFEYAFSLPNDCLRVVDTKGVGYITEGGKILCNSDTLYLKYVSSDINPASVPPDLAECIMLQLASKIAYQITQDMKIVDRLHTELNQFSLSSAAMRDSMERNSDETVSNWLDGSDREESEFCEIP